MRVTVEVHSCLMGWWYEYGMGWHASWGSNMTETCVKYCVFATAVVV